VTTAETAAPLVAGTIAYWGSLFPEGSDRGHQLTSPSAVKNLVFYMHRALTYDAYNLERHEDKPTDEDERDDYDPEEPNRPWDYPIPFLWSGETRDGNCLVQPWLAGCPTDLVSTPYSQLEPFRSDRRSCADGGAVKRQAGGQCQLVFNPPNNPVENPNGPGGVPGATGGGVLTYKAGSPSPTCRSNCGTLCSGFYCSPNPTGTPPGFWDPKDPSHVPSASTRTTPPSSVTSPPGLPPPLPTGPTCSGNEYPTTTLVCAGAGGHLACANNVICATSTITDGPPLPTLSACPRPMKTATVCFGGPGNTNCGTSLGCPPPAPTTTSAPAPAATTTAAGPTQFQSDEYLAVVEAQHQVWQGLFTGCQDTAPFFRIEVYREGHPGRIAVNCNSKGDYVAGSNVKMGTSMAGCNGGYTGGWSVCLTDAGARIYEPEGKWYQLCEPDDSLLVHCLAGTCWSSVRRWLKCDAIWRKDA